MEFARFTDFYPHYLAEHQTLACRRLHFLGLLLALGFVLRAVISLNPLWLIPALLSGYGLAWAGHQFFEKNRPTTFQHPIYSFMADWVMLKDILIGRVRI